MNLDSAVSAACRSFLFCSFKLFEQTTAYCSDENSSNVDHRSPTDFKSFVLEQSQKFRDRLRELNEHLSSIAQSLADREHANDMDLVDREYDLICGIEKSWYICEVFLLNPAKHLSLEMGKWLKETSYPYGSSELSIDFDRKISMQQPELCKSIQDESGMGSTLGFWDSVLDLLLQGNVIFAVELLQKHSEIAYAMLLTDDQDHSYRRTSSNRIDRNQCRLLFDTLLSHPYAMYVYEGNSNGENGTMDGTIDPNQAASYYTKEFQAWRLAVKRLRGEGQMTSISQQSNCSALIIRIPEIDTVLNILLGDKTAIYSAIEINSAVLSSGSQSLWMKMALALILYGYPPLGRADLGKVVEEAVAAHSARRRMNAEDEHSVQLIRQVMDGEIGPLMKQVYELTTVSGSDSDTRGEVQDMVSLVCLASTSHLSLLLTYAGAGAGLAVSSGLTSRLR